MMDFRYCLYVIFFMLILSSMIPLFSFVTESIYSLTELVKSKISYCIAKQQIKIEEIQEKNTTKDTQVIGFVSQLEDESDDEEWEENAYGKK